jgi:hypothetical protein
MGTFLDDSVSKSFRTGCLEREMQMIQLYATRCSYIATLWVSLVSFAAITLWVACHRVFVVVSIYFVIDSVRNLLVTPSYVCLCKYLRRNVAHSSAQGSILGVSKMEHLWNRFILTEILNVHDSPGWWSYMRHVSRNESVVFNSAIFSNCAELDSAQFVTTHVGLLFNFFERKKVLSLKRTLKSYW